MRAPVRRITVRLTTAMRRARLLREETNLKRRIFVLYLLIFVVAASMPAYGGKVAATKASIQPSSWWSPALLGASTSSNTGATSWEDCLAGGAPSTAAPRVGNCMKFTFKTSYWDPTNGTGPWMHLQCFRAGEDYEYEGQLSGVMILADSRPGFPGGWGYGVPFVLNGTSWHLGPANCTIRLTHRSKSGRLVVDASNRFSVSG
jgi:hypothetical protein